MYPGAVSHTLPPTDTRLRQLGDVLAAHPAAGEAPPVPREGHIEAAVSVVLRTAGDLEVLLIKRAVSERDPWSGHMALPGGRRDPADTDLLRTAVRETAEETGVRLDPSACHLGRLPEVTPNHERLPRLTVVPYVFGVAATTEARVSSPEVESVHWVSLPTLMRPETRRSVTIRLPDGPEDFPCFRVGELVVWGLTFRILTGFLELFDGA